MVSYSGTGNRKGRPHARLHLHHRATPRLHSQFPATWRSGGLARCRAVSSFTLGPYGVKRLSQRAWFKVKQYWVARPESSKGVVHLQSIRTSTPFEDSGRATRSSWFRAFEPCPPTGLRHLADSLATIPGCRYPMAGQVAGRIRQIQEKSGNRRKKRASGKMSHPKSEPRMKHRSNTDEEHDSPDSSLPRTGPVWRDES